MALGDITFYDEGAFGYPGDVSYRVTSGTTASINAGEPVAKPLGSAFVTTTTGAVPIIASDYFAGIAATTSNETSTAVGIVSVTKMLPGVTYLIAPTTAASFDTQSEYDALVGDRVLLDKTAAGVYTIAATDGASNGCVIEPLDISKYPGKVRFSIRNGISYLA